MIDINELRRLAQAATSGEWYVERGNHIYGRNEVTDGEEVWHPVIACTDDDEVNVNFEANAAFIAAANPAAVSEIIDRLEAAESDALEQARLLGMSGEREAALLSKLEAAEKERNALRAKIEAMERQEPVAWLHESRRDSDVVTDAVKHVWGKAVVGALAAYSTPLYLSPGAQPAPSLASGDVSLISEGKTQPAPSVPEGWKLVPVEPTETMISEGSCASGLPGPHYISEDCAKQCWEYMLAAAPEAKP